MNVRPLTLLVVLQTALWLSGCGTSDKASNASAPTTAPVAAITAVVESSRHNQPLAGNESSCTYCHAADGSSLSQPATADASASFQTCTRPSPDAGLACHAGVPPATPLAAMLPKNIQDTHYDDPATGLQDDKSLPLGVPDSNTLVEGYVLRKKLDTACRDCHDDHSTTITHHLEWGNSAHSGYMVAVKKSGAVGVSDETGVAWTHYDWDASSRAACQRCHTATGISNYLNAPASYDPAKNDFSHLAQWTDTNKKSPQNELLYCWGCHSSGDGSLRAPGAITTDYSYTLSYKDNGVDLRKAYPVQESFADVQHSNACLVCHSGRQLGLNVKNLPLTLAPATEGDPEVNVFTNLAFINAHYLAAGGILFAKSGYEFGGNYASRWDFRHDLNAGNVPLPASAAAKGPCVFCHMGSTSDHTWQVVEKNAGGEIVRVKSDVCGVCHADTYSNPANLTLKKQGYDQALAMLKGLLDAEGLYFAPESPYFFTAPYTEGYVESGACTANLPIKNWQKGGSSNFNWGLATATATSNSCVSTVNVVGDSGTGRDRMGAAFNYNLLIHEPGAFAHNSLYAKRLVFDSIDYLDNGILDGLITIDTGTYLAAARWYGAPAEQTGNFVAARP